MKTRKTRTSKKRTRKTRTGSSVLLALVVLFGIFAEPVEAKKKEKPAPEVFALVAGTTFRPPGFALPGVKVRLAPASKEVDGVRLRPSEAVTDSRGEFAVRVPVVPTEWTVYVQTKGYQPQTRTVRVDGEARLDLSFVLEPAEAGTTKGEGK